MDDLELYVKMCDNEDIQGLWEFEDGDLYEANTKHGKITTSLCINCNVADSYGETYVNEDTREGKYIWLPKQDQLQKMIKRFATIQLMQFEEEYSMEVWKTQYQPINSKSYTIVANTREQLELKFVMKEKFNKQWNGEQWVLIK